MAEENARDRMVAALMDVIGERGWIGASPDAVAARAGISLPELRAAFDGRGAMLAAFLRGIDAAVLARRDAELAGEVPRERLFDLLSARFDALAAHKRAVRNVVDAAWRDPLLGAELNRIAVTSMAWMLAAAGVRTDGVGGLVRAQALALAWLRILRIWFDDDDPDLARSLAELDRQLRRAERGARTVEWLKDCCVPGRRARRDREGMESAAMDLAEGHPS